MSQSPNQPSYQAWEERVSQLDKALRERGRENLVIVGVAPMRRLVQRLLEGASIPADEAVAALTTALQEIRRCIVSPEAIPDPAIFKRLEGMTGAMTEETPDEIAVSLLAQLADGEDNDLSALVGSLDGDSDASPAGPRDELGTLREPLGSGDSSARVLMKGELQPGLLTDLIQLFAQNRETGKLVVEGPHQVAHLYLADGQIVDAAHGDRENAEEAFYQLMLINEGRFSYQRGAQSDRVRIHRKTHHLIMDTLRLMDEAS